MTNQTNAKSMKFVDKFLTVWILLSMALGIILGEFTNASEVLKRVDVFDVNLPVAIGLWLMMWPVLTKVDYVAMKDIADKKILPSVGISLFLNWIVGPFLMLGLAWATLPDLPEYRNGVIMVGLARCIAMVFIWNQMAGGNQEYCAILVAINSVLQIVLYAPMTLLFINVISGQDTAFVGFWPVAKSVLIFLGIPMVAGIITQVFIVLLFGKRVFEEIVKPIISPISLIALIYTIIVLFALQGHEVISNIVDVIRVAVPMIVYFIIMWIGAFYVSKFFKLSFDIAVTQAFTAASNNFELAIAIAVGTFGVYSKEALAATVGPLIEVPMMLILVHLAKYLHPKESLPT